MAATPRVQKNTDFESLLLAVAGDLRQPLQILQSAHELLDLGVRTNSELSLLRSGQSAIDRLKEQLDQLLSALRLCEHAKHMTLTPIRVGALLQQASRDEEDPASRKGISISVVPTNASILSDALLLDAVLHNLVRNAVKYTQPGGRILLGCRHAGASVRPHRHVRQRCRHRGEHMPIIFQAFTCVEPLRRDSLGMGLFIACVKLSEFWDTGSSSLPHSPEGRDFPFSPPEPNEMNSTPPIPTEEQRKYDEWE
jgi:two-component system phosphate regulon sensor histidine kinase PhoR